MKIEILRGAEAVELLRDDGFVFAWSQLAAACPWTTSLQEPPFVRTWYSVYSHRYEPVLIIGRNQQDGLEGLLTLASENGQLVAAGTHHAEYQTWLALPGAGNAFMEQAVENLSTQFPGRRLRLQFLPGDAPTRWATEGRWRSRCDLIANPRGLIALGTGAELQASLRKKSNRSRISRLERAGPLSLEVVREPDRLDEVLPAVMEFCDLRQGAIYNDTPFAGDPHKRVLYRALMRIPGFLHITVLKAGEQIVSAHFDMRNRDTALLGLIAHSPFVAQHSPGKLHLLLLGLELLKEGIPTYDLTPGGEYKDRFATHYDQAHILTVSFGRNAAWQYRARRTAVKAVRQVCAGLGVDPEKLKRQLAMRKGRITSGHEDLATFEWSREQIARLPGERDQGPLCRNSLRDLLDYQPGPAFPLPRDQFWREALARFEAGCTLLTARIEGRVATLAWLRMPDSGSQTIFVQSLPSVVEFAFAHVNLILRLAAAEPRAERILLEVPQRFRDAVPETRA